MQKSQKSTKNRAEGTQVSTIKTERLEKINLKPCLIVLTGLSLSGKTTLGRKLEQSSNLIFLDVDDTRQEILPGKKWLGAEREKEIMLLSYKRNHEKAAALLDKKIPVILAATYSRNIYRELVYSLAARYGVSLKFFLLEIPNKEAMVRLEARAKNGESNSTITTLEGYMELKNRYVKIVKNDAFRLETTKPVDQLSNEILEILSKSDLLY
jgi:predicted kinase